MRRARTAVVLAPVLLACFAGLVGCAKKAPAGKHVAAPPAVAAAAPRLAYEPRQGQATYRHYCETCHGEAGAGDGFNAYNLDPHPRDLSDPAFQKAKSDADLDDAIRRGGGGVGLSALMPPWGHTLSERQISDLVAFVRSLRRA